MAHLRKYIKNTTPGNKGEGIYFDPQCVDGIDHDVTRNYMDIKVHIISGEVYNLRIAYSTEADFDNWVQTNIIAIAGDNPDISGCM